MPTRPETVTRGTCNNPETLSLAAQALFTHQRMALGVLLATLVHLDAHKAELDQAGQKGSTQFLQVYLAAAQRASNTTGHRAELAQSLQRLSGYHQQVGV